MRCCCNRHTDALGKAHQNYPKALLAARTLEQLWSMPKWPDSSEAKEQEKVFCGRGSWECSMHEGFCCVAAVTDTQTHSAHTTNTCQRLCWQPRTLEQLWCMPRWPGRSEVNSSHLAIHDKGLPEAANQQERKDKRTLRDYNRSFLRRQPRAAINSKHAQRLTNKSNESRLKKAYRCPRL